MAVVSNGYTLSESRAHQYTQEQWGSLLATKKKHEIFTEQGLIITDADPALCARARQVISDSHQLEKTYEALTNAALLPHERQVKIINMKEVHFTFDPRDNAYRVMSRDPIQITIVFLHKHMALSELYQKMIDGEVAFTFSVQPHQPLILSDFDVREPIELKNLSAEEQLAAITRLLSTKIPPGYTASLNAPGDLTVQPCVESDTMGLAFTGSKGFSITLTKV